MKKRPKTSRNALLGLLVAGFALLVAIPVTAVEPPPRDVSTSSEPRLAWPLAPEPEVVRPFEAPASSYGPGHRGVDLAAGPDQPVLAAAEGVVVFAGGLAGRGVISIDHDVLRTTYEPVLPAVAVGERVYAGQQIGTVATGHPGCARDACLHWGVRDGDEYLNPLLLVGEQAEIRLKPWESS